MAALKLVVEYVISNITTLGSDTFTSSVMFAPFVFLLLRQVVYMFKDITGAL